MPEVHDLTPEQIEALFTHADLVAEAHAWVELCATQGQATLARQESLADQAARWWGRTAPTEERLDASEA